MGTQTDSTLTQTSLDPLFMPNTVEGKSLRKLTGKRIQPAELRRAIIDASFNATYDFLRKVALDSVSRENHQFAISTIEGLNDLLSRALTDDEQETKMLDIHAALLQILTALNIQAGNNENARNTAAQALTILTRNPKRRDEAFLTLLATLLFDISVLHAEASEFKQAERELEKALKLLDRLGAINPDRYGPAHVMATAAATQVYRNRVKQANLLAHYQVATQTYLSQVNQGIDSAIDHLAESLFTEGQTLADMGRHREAITYFTKAIKYYSRLHDDTDIRQLQMSIELGKSLLYVKGTRDKAIHLLNTLLHKATKIKADPEHRAIVDILANCKSRQLDILDIWYKVFPR